MSVHNGAPYVETAIKSILSQSFSDFELVIVDDASTDNTLSILEGYSDRRLSILRNSKNLGSASSLNLALERAEGEFVARMDADDISLSCRLEKQTSFLDAHPEIGILGSAYFRMIVSGRRFGSPVLKPETDQEIRWAILLENPFCHPSIMFRRRVLVNHGLSYNSKFTTTQDYELWVRMLEHCEGANLRDPLLLYRIHRKSVSWKNREIQQRNSVLVSSKAIHSILPTIQITDDIIHLLQKCMFGNLRFRFPVGVNRGDVVKAYMELFYAFENSIGGTKIDRVRRTVALFSAYIVLHYPFEPNLLGYLKQAKLLYPKLAWEYPAFALRIFVRKLARWIVSYLNRNILKHTAMIS